MLQEMRRSESSRSGSSVYSESDGRWSQEKAGLLEKEPKEKVKPPGEVH